MRVRVGATMNCDRLAWQVVARRCLLLTKRWLPPAYGALPAGANGEHIGCGRIHGSAVTNVCTGGGGRCGCVLARWACGGGQVE
jgi:hypothetical protein